MPADEWSCTQMGLGSPDVLAMAGPTRTTNHTSDAIHAGPAQAWGRRMGPPPVPGGRRNSATLPDRRGAGRDRRHVARYFEAVSAAPTAAWPAASRAVSTRNGEQLT